MITELVMSLQGWPLAVIIVSALVIFAATIILNAIVDLTSQTAEWIEELARMRKIVAEYTDFKANYESTLARIAADNQKAVNEMINKVVGL